jgi:pimeloyl-ACP methyl ester carboxylesterase
MKALGRPASSVENHALPMQTRHIHSSGISLYSESFGAPHDPAILLIMGALSSAVWWPDDFCVRLADQSRYVIRYDHRDTGRSTSYPPGQAGYAVEDLADDAIRILDGYEIERSHLVGMSLGGYLSQIVALKHPDRVRTLTLIASERLALADPDMPAIDPSIVEYHGQFAELDWSDREAVVEYQVGAWRLQSGPAHPFDEAAIRRIAIANFDRSPDLHTTYNHASLGDATGWVGQLERISAPTLVIHGTSDPVLPYAHGVALAREIPNATLLTLEGTGHELHEADWGTILDAIEWHTRS